MEELLNGIIIGMLRLAYAVKAKQAEQEREAREKRSRQQALEEARAEQQRLEEARAQEQAKVERLLLLAREWRESQNLRLFVEQARGRGGLLQLGLEGQQFDDWVRWALQQVDRLDPSEPSPPSIVEETEIIDQTDNNPFGRR